MLTKEEIIARLEDKFDISHNKDKADFLYFYGAGCGTDRMKNFLTEVFQEYFSVMQKFRYMKILMPPFLPRLQKMKKLLFVF